MDRHHTADRPAAHHHVTAPLTHGDEAEVLQRTNGFRSRDDRQLRQRQRYGMS
jgi:hypothetical protein